MSEEDTYIPERGAVLSGAVAVRTRCSASHLFMRLGSAFITLVMFTLLLATALVYDGKRAFQMAGPSDRAQTLLISSGLGVGDIGALLEKRRLIRWSLLFVMGVRLAGESRTLKAGEYAIPAYASMRTIMDILATGKSIEYSLTIPEGLTVQQVFDRLANDSVLKGRLPTVLPPEGSLVADTVQFVRGTSRAEIVQRLENDQKKLVDALWRGRASDLPLGSKEEFVILASIVEKESALASERPMIAAVFYNRLAKNMRLQSDPTVLYGLFGGAGKPAGRPIYRSDLEKDTPYNTYKISGLPPTPIAIPGRSALEAVAHPAQTDALYFVADGNGGHVFSKTLDEHNAHVRRWRALQKDRR